MKIGIDARFYSPAFTGIGRYVYELVHNLLEMDSHNEYVLFFNDPYFKEFKSDSPRVRKVLVNAPHYSIAEQWKFWRILEREKLDLMHFTHFNAPILYRKPSIVTIHDLTLSFFPGKKMTSFIERLGYNFTIRSIVKRASRIIAVSQNTKEDIVKLLHVSAKKISVIYEAVSSKFHLLKDRSLLADFFKKHSIKGPYILYTGVWRSHKNLVNLIHAFAVLKREFGFTGELVITGKEDPWYPEVKQAVHDLDLKSSVRFTGMIPEDELILLYNGAILYAFPSLYEGFGLPALEAFACGVPVCASNSSSLPEICGEGNAVFFDPQNPEDMAAKMESVISDPKKMAHLRERGLARIKDFSWKEMAKQTLSLYTSLDVHAHSTTASKSHDGPRS